MRHAQTRPSLTRRPHGEGRRIVGGFTLIELLIVIGIIALLMAILLPALGRARQEAQKISCASNLRNWGNSLQVWANDHNNAFPYNGGSPDGLYRTEPPYWDGEYHQFVAEYLTGYDYEAIQGGENTVLFCPTHMWERSHTWEGVNLSDPNNQTHLTLGYFILAGRTPPPGHKHFYRGTRDWVMKMHFDGPFSRTPVMADIIHYVDGSVWRDGRPVSSHVNPSDRETVLGSNFLFEDVSVQWHNYDVIEKCVEQDGGHREYAFWIPIPGIVSDDDL